jgi:hypothetical protein
LSEPPVEQAEFLVLIEREHHTRTELGDGIRGRSHRGERATEHFAERGEEPSRRRRSRLAVDGQEGNSAVQQPVSECREEACFPDASEPHHERHRGAIVARAPKQLLELALASDERGAPLCAHPITDRRGGCAPCRSFSP